MNRQPAEACPCCGSHNLQRIGKLPDGNFFSGTRLSSPLPGGNLYRCHHCRLKFRHPVPDDAIYAGLYNNATTSTWPAESLRPDWTLIKRHVLKHLPQGGRVLDFGCYTGGFLARLGSGVYERYGIEINRTAAAIASQHADAPIWSTVEDVPGDLHFDIIVAADVIEHVPNPMDLIDRLTALLTDRGILILTTGDADNFLWNRFGANWWYCFYPEHIAFVSKDWFYYLSRAREVSIILLDTFCYQRQLPVHWFFNSIFTYWYGWLPQSYLYLRNLFNNALGRPGLTSVPGNGVTADHLFVVLTRKARP